MKDMKAIYDRIADAEDTMKAYIQSSLSNVQRLLPELEISEIEVSLLSNKIPGSEVMNVENVTIVYNVAES